MLCSLHVTPCATTYIKPWKRRNQIDFIALYVPLCKCKFTTGLKIEPLNCLLRLFSAAHYGQGNYYSYYEKFQYQARSNYSSCIEVICLEFYTVMIRLSYVEKISVFKAPEGK